MKVLAVCLALIYSVHAQISDDPCNGVMIGALTPAYHDVTGVLYVEGEYEFCIANFTYDGEGPDTFLYFYYPGDPISNEGGGVIIPITTQASNRPQFDLDVAYRTGDGHYRFTLRENQYRACDFEGFGIWCRIFNVHFATITWNNTDIFSAEGNANTIQCTASPGRGYVGMLPTFSNNLGGQLYIKDNKTFVIRDFAYDGQGSDTFVYVFEGVVADGADNNARPDGQGYIIPLTQNNEENGAFDGTVYAAGEADFTITIPNDMDLFTCDVATFTIKSRVGTGLFFTRIEVASELFTNNRDVSNYQTGLLLCNRTSTQPGYFIGNLPTTTNPMAPYSGTVYVQDRNIIFIQLFSYSAELDNVFIYSWPRGQTPQGNGAGGTIINRSATQDKFPMGTENSFYNGYITIDLRLAQGGPLQTCDIGSFAFIATDTNTILSQMNIPSYAFSEDGDGDTIMCTAGARALASTLTIFGACAIAMIAMLFKA